MSPEDKVYIVDDNIEICNSLSWLFESFCLKVETYSSSVKFLSNYQSAWQGCLILDVKMPKMSGIELLEKINSQKNSLATVLITGYADIPMAVRAMKAGAVDFILKPINEEYLVKTIFYYLKNPPTKKLFNLSNPNPRLTKREKEVLNLIMEGKLNKEIAYKFNISLSTVEAHRARIMDKFHAKNIVQLVKKYFNISDNDQIE